jgi:transcription initiation factor TFIIH subunit 4
VSPSQRGELRTPGIPGLAKAGRTSACMDFSAYLSTLPQEQLTYLYDSPWTCQAVLRSLPPLPQQFILRLLFLSEAVPIQWLRSAVTAEFSKSCEQSLSLLSDLRVLEHIHGPGGGSRQLAPTFQARLQQSVLNPVSLGQRVGPARPLASPSSSLSDINAFGSSQWQAVLLALVEGRRTKLKGHAELNTLDGHSLFINAGLLDDASELTDAGFKFLFLDVYSQLWQLLQQYLKKAGHDDGNSLADALSFLLQLSFRKVWACACAHGH